VRPKKALGQHFLTDMSVARRIADAMSEGGDVLEVGCGTGVLTQFLLQRPDITTWGAEVDGESVEYLHNHYPDFTPRLIYGDFLNLPLSEMFPAGLKVIGNFPYNISSQIFFKVLDYKELIPEVVGMVQREVALRIASPAGNRDYGILSVLMQAWYDIEYLFTVHEDVFNPPPKVKSAVVRMRRNSVKELGCNEELFVKVVKAAFSQRRKMLKTPLKAIFGDFGGAEHEFFSLRAEALTVEDYIALTNWVEERMS
jgi:16S rRNA (adenine1518-N6/adenine1519-N6)-dimethyltransferase